MREPLFEARIGAILAGRRGGVGVPDKRVRAGDADMDLLRIRDVRHLRERNDALHDMRSIEFTWRVLDTRQPGRSIFIYPSGVAVSPDGDEAVHLSEFEGAELEVKPGVPV